MLSSNPVALPPEAGDPPGGQGTGFRYVQGVPTTYQPGEKSETYHRDDLCYEQSVHVGRR